MKTVSSTSMKYARALAEVAAESDVTQIVQVGLGAFQETFHTHRDLRDALFCPSVPLVAKRNIVANVAEKMGISEILRNFLFVILERSRLQLLDELVESYQEVLDERAGVARVAVRSSHPLTSNIRERLQNAMSKKTGRTVKCSYKVDEDLLGGVRLQVGSVVYDGSIRTQLEELRRQLASATF